MSRQHPMPSWRAWFLAIRPKTLPAAAAPVITGTALAYSAQSLRWGPALAALLGALLLQIASNLANDVFDYERGADQGERLGPTRVTQSGLLTPGQVKRCLLVVISLSTLVGLYLIWAAGWPVLLIGLAAILASVAYTGGPFPLAYHGLGDLFVFIFFGLVATLGTYYVQALALSPAAWALGVALGFLIVNILVVNNLRDLENDRRAGKRTLAVRLGADRTRLEYLLCLSGAYLIPLLVALMGWASYWGLLSWITVPKAIRLARALYSQQGRALNHTLAGSGQLALWYALSFAAGIVLATMV
ncbi:MAG: 1,4-dihydroxy-2-naphthoate polyprenyltransferase [Anaerolineales bacterium]|nr:1,4-dihydroxy-2-naphthoate polyprenyltransferase [Anaerolineales bacterium]